MSPTAKDLDLTTPNSTTPGVRPASVGTQDENAGKPQPVPLEVPVTVNGARTVEGSDKREPFSETTQTVLVFGNGGVIRLASSVAAGQLLFLTNEKTKKEVVCQVVKSKNYRNVSGYVELEFTESVPGFWGMRFPGERVPAQPSASAPAAKPVAPSSVAPKIDAPAVNTVPQRVEPKVTPVQPPLAPAATITTSALHADVKPTLNLPRAAEPRPVSAAPTPVSQSTVAPVNVAPHVPLPKAPGLTDGFGSGLTSTARPPDDRSLSSVVPKLPQSPVSQDSSDALLRESERLHEQLASMLFAAEVPATPVQATPVQPTAAPPPPHKPLTVDSLAKVVEIAKPQISAPKVVPPPKNAPIQMHSSLDDEQVKIPSWLEPLARNAATQAQNETVARAEAAASANRVIEFEVQDVSAPAIAQVEEVPATEVSHSHFVEEAITVQSASQRKNKVVLIGAIAAGVLLTAAGGTWYARRSSAPAQPAPAAVVASVPEVAASIAAPPAPHGSEKAAGRSVAEVSSPNRSNINSEPVAKLQGSSAQGNSQSITPASEVVKIAPDKNTAAELSAYKKLAEPQPQPEPKRSSLGTVRLSAPNANRNPVAPELGDADAGLSLSGTQVTPAGDAFGGGLVAGNSKQPVAPAVVLPIGGDVKPAHLLSSVPPAYPSLAKTQRIEGAVRIDAVVDPNGRISSMKVMSGPALLHQAAMDALHQWKYQPATLDGKPVPMHLTVTVQFRLQ
jgi:periplasmic protein TonB